MNGVEPRLVFGIFASIAEFERKLIRERVRSGLARARARGKRLARPDANKAAALRAQGVSWREIAARLGVGIGTVHKVAQGRSKNHSLAAPVRG